MANNPGPQARARAFGDAAQEYDTIRLAPPPEAVRWLLAGDESRVLDLAAGTGQLSRVLESLAVEVIAVEPDERMRAVLQERSPRVRVMEGVAEHIPLPDGGVDAVLVGSAWHWFDQERALAETARVLRDGGRLGVIGTSPDPFVDWVGELFDSELDIHKGKVRASYVDISLPLAAAFGPVSTASFPSAVRLPAGQVLALFATHSNYLVASEEEQTRLDDNARRVLADRIDSGAVELPIRSWGWRAERDSR